MIKNVGVITQAIVNLLGLSCTANTPILLGPSNIQHMKSSHPSDYQKYSPYISAILSSPDYVGINNADSSIEYVKEFIQDNNYVKVAVRVSASGQYFARSIYVLNINRVNNFIAKGTLKKFDKI